MSWTQAQPARMFSLFRFFKGRDLSFFLGKCPHTRARKISLRLRGNLRVHG